MKRVLGILSLVLVLGAPSAHALVKFNLGGGASIAGGDANTGQSAFSPLLGAEFNFGLSGFLEIGGFFDYNFLLKDSAASGGQAMFYGFLFRYYIVGALGVFIDAKIGLTQASQASVSGDTKFGYGIRGGAKLPFGESTDLMPFAGLRFLPYSAGGTSNTRSLFDFGVMISWELSPY